MSKKCRNKNNINNPLTLIVLPLEVQMSVRKKNSNNNNSDNPLTSHRTRGGKNPGRCQVDKEWVLEL